MSAGPATSADHHQRPAHHEPSTVDGVVDRFGTGPDTVQTRWGPITPATISQSDPDPARRMLFYTGVGHPHHLNHSPVPLFISATTLVRYRRRGPDFPVRMTGAGWAGDSGAYTALTGTSPDHPWHADPDTFGGMWVRFGDDVGPPDFVAIQDWPCEPAARVRTGLTVRQHQQYTLDSYLYLAEQFPMVPWIPVLQGWHAWQYEEHADMYERAGVALADCGRVGLGSVCRRGSDTDIAELVTRLAARGYRLHGFGVSITGLRRIGHLLASSDSQAWSRTARTERIRLPGCQHESRPDPAGVRHPTDCRNCFRYALHYREQVLVAVRQAATAARHHLPPMFDLPATARSMPARPARTDHARPPAAGHPDQLALFGPVPARQPATPHGRAGVTGRRVTSHRPALPAWSTPLPALDGARPPATGHRPGRHRVHCGGDTMTDPMTRHGRRQPASGGCGAVQLDLFGEVAARLAADQQAADRQDARRRLLAAFQATKHRHPGTGADLGPLMWCGRCGTVERNELLIAINHELGWCAGCYTRFRPGVLASPFAHLSQAQRADRWDRQFFADCASCAHAWGLHGWDIGGGHDSDAGCQALLRPSCRCSAYQPPAAPGPTHR